MDKKIRIPEFFAGKNIFITGGSGFLGKVLIEKLLRSCPDVGDIYTLLRPKKGKSGWERVKLITDDGLFDTLKSQNPEALKKIIPLDGDVSSLKLGLKESDEEILVNRVNIIFHCAASVRFDERLRDAIILNTRGAREVAILAKKIKDLSVLLHVSTTYAHTDKKVIEEEVWPTNLSWKEAIELAENYDPYILDILCTKYMNGFPNTYTFTKNLAEHVIKDLCDNVVPTLICRPSIVISTLVDPVMGWIDNFNGPVGLLSASGSGVVRTMYATPDIKPDYVPVDLLIKAFLIAVWDKGCQKPETKFKLDVLNCSNNSTKVFTSGEIEEYGPSIVWDTPLEKMIWYPQTKTITTNYYHHYIKLIFYQLLPALFIDGLLKLTNNKPILVKVHRRVFIANMALYYFISQEWKFINKKVLALEETVSEIDKKDFGYDQNSPLAEPKVYFKNATIGAKKYLFKEKATLAECRRGLYRMWIISIIFNTLYYIGLFWLLYYKLDVVGLLRNMYERIEIYLTNL